MAVNVVEPNEETPMLLKRTFLAIALASASLCLLPLSQAADAYPEKEVKMVIPFAPGGATDVVFRIISEAAEKELGKPIVPVNMSGAGGSKGSVYVKGSKADGYTLLGGHEFLMTTKYAGMVPFGLEAFEPVCTLTVTPLIITAAENTPYKNYGELVEYVKANPGKVVVAMTPASVQYVLWKNASEKSGLDFEKDYRVVIINGTGPQTKALLGGHADVFTGDYPSDAEYVKDGRMKFLGVAYTDRLPQIPEVATLKEQGADALLGVTRAIFAPKGTPKEVIDKIADAYKKALEDPALVKKIEDMGNVVTYMGPEATAKYFGEQDQVYKAALAK
ncbi:MAG: tripartite tricarboxylate transporter substrate binding protein [Burkholderiales bacterium]|nr:tripartite tricarboxylate transporter substrate binding protein [Burkholderiales bacterium]